MHVPLPRSKSTELVFGIWLKVRFSSSRPAMRLHDFTLSTLELFLEQAEDVEESSRSPFFFRANMVPKEGWLN